MRHPGGAVALDRAGHAPGRGAYLHPAPACLAAARKRRAVDRALGAAVPAEVWAELAAEHGVTEGGQVSNSR